MPGLLVRTIGALLLCATVAAAGAPAERAIVIGGGPSLGESQAQIEQNVLWLQRLLPALGYDVDMYFGIGGAPGEDVVLSSHSETALADPYYALDLVFTEAGAVPLEFRRHLVRDVLGSTRREELLPALRATLKALAPGSSLLLVFNGHGGEGGRADDDNSMALWGAGDLTVAELDGLLGAASDTLTIRFVMPQCFSGGFARLMYRQAGSRQLSAQNRCGFLSQAAERAAEGCQLGIDAIEYRDYTTYLFAALAGHARDGSPLASDPDLDRSGSVSFREAHWYALRTAQSFDLSRSTSEVFLEDWERPALRDAPIAAPPDAVYVGIARDIAARHGWSLSPAALDATLATLTTAVARRIEATEAIAERISRAQAPLRAMLRKRWPFLVADYDGIDWAQHVAVVDAIDRFLRRQPGFATIRRLTAAYIAAETAALEAERLKVQAEKVRRMLHLARLASLFALHARPDERQQYERLVGCESAAPPGRR